MKISKLYKILSLFSLVVPVNIYIIGDYLGAGVQFVLFRYQITYLGSVFISVFHDLNYILNGAFFGKTAISIIFWVIGVLCLFIAILLFFIKSYEDVENSIRGGLLIVISAILFLISIVIQYGITFSGPAGVSIPVGIPLLFVIGIWIFYNEKKYKKPRQQ